MRTPAKSHFRQRAGVHSLAAYSPLIPQTRVAGGKSVQGNAVSKEGDDAAPIAKRVGSSKPEQLPETTPSVLPQWWSALRRSVEWICTKTGLAAAKKEIDQAASAAAIRKSLVSPELARKTAERCEEQLRKDTPWVAKAVLKWERLYCA